MWKVSANRDNSARRRHRRFHSQQRRRASSAVDLRRAKNVTVVNPLVERTAFNYVVGPLVMSFNQAFREIMTGSIRCCCPYTTLWAFWARGRRTRDSLFLVGLHDSTLRSADGARPQ